LGCPIKREQHAARKEGSDNELVRLLDRSHTLNGAVLLGLDGLTIEIQARAMAVDEDGLPWRRAVKISGMAKEAAVLAAAGGHNLLLIGPPGEGKSLLASAMPGILPRLSDAEKVQLTRIYSASGAVRDRRDAARELLTRGQA
jgi:predicted ATPase with chaperone activity